MIRIISEFKYFNNVVFKHGFKYDNSTDIKDFVMNNNSNDNNNCNKDKNKKNKQQGKIDLDIYYMIVIIENIGLP